MTGIDFAPLVALGLVLYTLLNAAKYMMNRDWNALLTQIVGFGIAIGVVFLFSATDWADKIGVGDKTLANINGLSKVVVAFVVLAVGVGGYDFKRAIDRSDSAQTPPLTGTLFTKDAPAGFDPNPNVTTTPPVPTAITIPDEQPTAEG